MIAEGTFENRNAEALSIGGALRIVQRAKMSRYEEPQSFVVAKT